MLDPALGYLIVASIALLFASAGTHKLRGLARFIDIFAAFHLFPTPAALRLAWVIPCIEITIAGGLGYEPTRRLAIACGSAVLIAYAAALGLNLLRGRLDLDCGCGMARDRRTIAAWMLWRNLLLAALLGIAALPWSPRVLNPTDALTIMGGLVAAILLYAAVDRLLGDVAPKTVLLRSTS